MNHADREIIRLIKDEASREQGFRLLMQAYQQRLYFSIRRIVNDHTDADDVFQNTMVRIMNNIPGFRADSGLFTWMYRIATNEALAFRKAKLRMAAREVEAHELPLKDIQGANSGPAVQEIHDALISAIATLPEKQRLIFQLRYFDELSYAELSKMLKTSEGNLKAAYHIASQKIIKYIRSIK